MYLCNHPKPFVLTWVTTSIAHAHKITTLFSSFGEEDFQRFCVKLTMFKLFLAIISLIM